MRGAREAPRSPKKERVVAGVRVRSGGASHVHWSGRKVELAAARHPQQSPQRSEVFLEGVFFSLNPRPHIYLGTPEHEHRELTFRRTRPTGPSDHSSLSRNAAATMTGNKQPSGAGRWNQWRWQPYEPLLERSLSLRNQTRHCWAGPPIEASFRRQQPEFLSQDSWATLGNTR